MIRQSIEEANPDDEFQSTFENNRTKNSKTNQGSKIIVGSEFPDIPSPKTPLIMDESTNVLQVKEKEPSVEN